MRKNLHFLFATQVDHFGFANADTFKQRYLINKDHWNDGGPIFFYTGNEGDITWFCNNTVCRAWLVKKVLLDICSQPNKILVCMSTDPWVFVCMWDENLDFWLALQPPKACSDAHIYQCLLNEHVQRHIFSSCDPLDLSFIYPVSTE